MPSLPHAYHEAPINAACTSSRLFRPPLLGYPLPHAFDEASMSAWRISPPLLLSTDISSPLHLSFPFTPIAKTPSISGALRLSSSDLLSSIAYPPLSCFSWGLGRSPMHLASSVPFLLCACPILMSLMKPRQRELHLASPAPSAFFHSVPLLCVPFERLSGSPHQYRMKLTWSFPFSRLPFPCLS